MSWDPQRYNQFQSQRFEPFEDLLRWLEVRPGLRAVDLGCGTGELTRRLADLLPDSSFWGVDSSPQMLAESTRWERPGLSFEEGRLEQVEGEFDLIFSHAALHWAEDHRTLFGRLWSQLRPGGQLLVQMPANFDHYTHTLAGQLAAEEFSLTPRRAPVLKPEEYSQLLYELGCERPQVVLKVYPHLLADNQALLEWVRGTLLTAYLPQLSESDQERFLGLYAEALPRTSGPVFYPFKRLLMSAMKG